MQTNPKLNRALKTFGWVAADALLINLALVLAQLLRYSYGSDPAFWTASLRLAPIMTAIFLFTYGVCGVYSELWEYLTASEILRVTAASLAASCVTYGASLACNAIAGGENLFLLHRLVYLLLWLIASVLVGTSRILYRFRKDKKRMAGQGKPVRVMVIGAGWAGANLVHDMLEGHYGNRTPVVIVDDDLNRVGFRINGVRIVRGSGNILKLVSDYSVQEIFIAIATPLGNLQQVIDKCLVSGCKVRRVTPFEEVHLASASGAGEKNR